MTEPRYRGLKSSEIPEVKRDDGITVKVIAGEFEGVKGAVKEIFAEPEYLDISIPSGGFLNTLLNRVILLLLMFLRVKGPLETLS